MITDSSEDPRASHRFRASLRFAHRAPRAARPLADLRSIASLAAALACSLACAGALAAAPASAFTTPKVRHVFVIMLENEGYKATFGTPGADPYLAQALPSQGALLEEYFATGHVSNDNYISLVSGQPPNPENQSDCMSFDNFTAAGTRADGVEEGVGCVYPSNIANIGTQLTGAKLGWKAYMEDMGNIKTRESVACGHPAVGAKDETQTAVAGDGYATRHDPFVYFHSVIDDQAYCDKHVVALGSPAGVMPEGAPPSETGLATDLSAYAKTPNFVFVTPDLCDDGHDSPCKNETGGATALASIDTFLETWVPKITGSEAFKKNGLLEIAFDEAGNSETEACCGEEAGPASPFPGITGPGGGRVGAVLISPFIKGGTISTVEYNHYSSLASWETFFSLPRLADAAKITTTFGPDVFTNAP